MMTKQGAAGTKVPLSCNYFDFEKVTSWTLHQYEVDISPEIENKRVKGAVVFSLRDRIGHNVYRGARELYGIKKLPEETTVMQIEDKKNPEIVYTVTLTYRSELKPGDQGYCLFFDNMLRKIMGSLQLTEHNGTYFDTNAAIKVLEFFT